MKNILSLIVVFILYAVVGGCTDGVLSSSCDNPIKVNDADDQPVPGFIVVIADSKKTKDVEAAFAKKYDDLTVFSSFSRNNSFYAIFGSETLKNLQCEPDVIAISTM